MHSIRSQKGFSLLEVLVVVAFVAIMAALSFPLIQTTMQQSRASGAADLLAAAIRDARMRAIASGNQYQVIAYSRTGAVPNAFRIQGSTDGGITWPAVGTVTTPPGPINDAYTDLGNLAQRQNPDFGNVQIQIPGGGASFIVTFDGRGQQAGACVPAACTVQVVTPARQATLTVSRVGSVIVQ